MKAQIDDLLNRQSRAAGAQSRTFVHRAVKRSATKASRRLVLEATAELMNQALFTFIDLLYDDVDGVLVNVAADGRILVPTPWSRGRHADYGLTDGQHRTLRTLMIERQRNRPGRFILVFYSPEMRFWYLNSRHFPTMPDALAWLDTERITAADLAHHSRV